MREIVVTDGGTGIGFAVASALLARGDRVAVTGRREQASREAAKNPGARLGG
ncbi:SDR family NAD(P)-dependent oxidoreductase [Streptosporangium carneum]|uniref:SDR family NAD(P)-dependent oxidoreductase n=1 Tax=Streptosporangium carneum TaxID=47481 RepID=UPI0022F2DC56|nr:SDR family NAD(P)-dependent oxidoreductase [Streptosporangium carneum]